MFKWGLAIVIIAGLVGIPWIYRELDNEIRRQVESRFAAHYPDLLVSVHSARLVEGEGIHIKGLRILEPGLDAAQAELIYVDEMIVQCSTALKHLAAGDLHSRQVILRRPRMRASRMFDGGWSVQQLWPPPQFSEVPIETVVENATIEVIDELKQSPSRYSLRDVNLSITPELADDGTISDNLATIRGSLSADHLRQVQFAGELDREKVTISLAGNLQGLDISPELHAALPGQLDGPLEPLRSLRAMASAEFRIDYDRDAVQPLTFDVRGKIERGRLDDPRLPYPLTDLQANVHCTNDLIDVTNVFCRSRQTTVQLSLRREGLGPLKPMHLNASARQLVIDRHLVAILPEELRDAWQKFQPTGEIDIDADLRFDGQKWHPRLDVKCLDVALVYEKFPFRLERGAGTLRLHDDLLTMDLTAYANTDPLRITAAIRSPGPDWKGVVDVNCPHLELGEDVLAALPDSSRAVVRSLHPHGVISGNIRCWQQEDLVTHKSAHIDLNNCTVRYDGFPYAIDGVKGSIDLRDDLWTFSNLTGINYPGQITCQGKLLGEEEGRGLELYFTGTNIRLDEQLRAALDQRAQRVWGELQPRGAIDMNCLVRFQPDPRQLQVWVNLSPRPEVTSIQPIGFPYRLEQVRGPISFNNGVVQFENLRAQHGATSLLCTGKAQGLDDGGWWLGFEKCIVERLAVDRDLHAALPPSLKTILLQLHPTGRFNLAGAMELAQSGAPKSPITAQWDTNVYFHQNNISAGVNLESLHGAVRLTGRFDGEHTICNGELNLDAVTYNEFQFTEVRGPMYIEDNKVVLGYGAQPVAPGRPPRHVSAKVLDGNVVADAWVVSSDSSQYALQATLSDASLQRFSLETALADEQLSGKVFGTIDLRGSGSRQLTGNGSLQLRDADIYELPIMVALLKILSVREPDTTAFTKSDIDFRIDGEHIYFSRLNFTGDAISLVGGGEMNMNRDISLAFHALVGRNDIRVPLISDVLGKASEQIMKIYVDGNLDNPRTRSELFPVVRQELERIQTELQRMNTLPTRTTDPVPRVGQR